MSITSIEFLGFLVLIFCLFYVCPVKIRWLVLLGASIWFYISAGAVVFLPFIIATSAIIWFCGYVIGKRYERQDRLLQKISDKEVKKALRNKTKKSAKRYLIFALVTCVGMLCISKFGSLAVDYMNTLMGGTEEEPVIRAAVWLVPLGISYYTFSTVGYLLDVYWKRCAYEKNFLRFFLYAIYFPHIIQGPISRYNSLGSELKKELRFDSRRIVFGMELMLWGFFKKIVIADRLSPFVAAVFDGEVRAGSVFLLTLFLDVILIYTDFSGYTDIVRGVSQVFGVELEQNFNHPFFAKSVPELWRRWHMTLGGWFRDYVYTPCTMSGFVKNIGKARGKKKNRSIMRIIIPVCVTWILTGVWHGTGMPYVAWGIYYSILMSLSVLFQETSKKINGFLRINTECFSWRLFQMIRTFICFMGGRLLTTPGSLATSFMIFSNIFTNFAPGQIFADAHLEFGIDESSMTLVFVCVIVLWAVSMLQEYFAAQGSSVREKLAEQNIVFRWAIIYIAIFAIFIFGAYGKGYDPSAFIYAQY